jgi:hypothetical protein
MTLPSVPPQPPDTLLGGTMSLEPWRYDHLLNCIAVDCGYSKEGTDLVGPLISIFTSAKGRLPPRHVQAAQWRAATEWMVARDDGGGKELARPRRIFQDIAVLVYGAFSQFPILAVVSARLGLRAGRLGCMWGWTCSLCWCTRAPTVFISDGRRVRINY